MAELEDVPVALGQLLAALDGDALPLTDPYTAAVLEVARSAAGGHPTPQARMAASGLRAANGAILGSAGSIVSGSGGSASLSAIILGAEFGSDRYRQFGPRNSRGYWLFPSFEDKSAISAGERALEDICAKVVR